MFILASFVCKSLQCLISTLTQESEDVTYLGSLVQLCCGEGGTLQINITGICGECSQCMDHTGLAPAHRLRVLSWATLLRLQVALHGYCPKWTLRIMHVPGLSCSDSGSRVLCKGTDSVGHAFCALPRSEQFRRSGSWVLHKGIDLIWPVCCAW